MPMMSAASKPSRSVTTNVPPMDPRLLRDDAARRLLVEVVEEGIGAGLEGANPDVDGLPGRHDLLDAEILALEFRRLRALVRDHEDEGGIRFDLHLVGLELIFLDGEGNFLRRVRGGRGPDDRGESDDDARDQPVEALAHAPLPTTGLGTQARS